MLISFLVAYLGRNELAPILSSISPFLCYQDANIKKPTKKAGISTSMTTTSQVALYKSKLQFSPGYKLAVQNGGVHKRKFDKVKDAFLKTPLGVYFYKHVSVAEMKIFRFLGPTSTFKGWNNQLDCAICSNVLFCLSFRDATCNKCQRKQLREALLFPL